LATLKESLIAIDIIKETKMKKIKSAIPPLFSKVLEATGDFELSVD
jgi:hypothetical protein